MRSLKLILAALVAALLVFVGVAPAQAAKPAPAPSTGEVIYLDPFGAESLPLAEVAADWSKNTDITVVVAPCQGDNCIHFSIVDNPCNVGTGGVIIGYIAGCATASADPGACDVQINDLGAVTDPNMRLYATKHEAGHCIYWFGGAGFIHLPYDGRGNKPLMSEGGSGYPTDQETRLTSTDRQFAADLF